MSLLLLFRRRRPYLIGTPARGRGHYRLRLQDEVKKKKRPKFVLSSSAAKIVADIKKSLKRLESNDISIPSVANDLNLIHSLLNPPIEEPKVISAKDNPITPLVDDLIKDMQREMEDAILIIILADE